MCAPKSRSSWLVFVRGRNLASLNQVSGDKPGPIGTIIIQTLTSEPLGCRPCAIRRQQGTGVTAIQTSQGQARMQRLSFLILVKDKERKAHMFHLQNPALEKNKKMIHLQNHPDQEKNKKRPALEKEKPMKAEM